MGSPTERPGRGLYYGWLIVLVGGVSAFWASGIGSDSFAVLLKPFAEDLRISRTTAVFGATVGAVAAGVLAPLVGPVVDKRGARWPMVVSAAAAGAALVGLSKMRHVWHFLLLFGVVLGGTRPGMQTISPSTAVINWFIRKRGRAITLLYVGQPLSKVIIVPLTQWITGSFGWRAAWLVLGVGVWATVLLPAALIVRRRPEDMGLLPDGDAPEGRGEPSAAATGGPDTHHEAVREVNWKARDALRTPAFWQLALAFAAFDVAISGLFIHMFPYFTDQGISPGVAAGALGTFGVAIISSRLLFWMFLLDRLTIRYNLILWGLVITGAVGSMTLVQDAPSAYGAAAFFGFAMGGSAPLSRLVWPQYYGRMAVGTISGVSQFFRSATAAAGPLVASFTYDVTGSYLGALRLFSVCCVVGVAMLVVARQPHPPEPPQASPAVVDPLAHPGPRLSP